MWKTTATAVATIALLTTSCGSPQGVETARTVPDGVDEPSVENLAEPPPPAPAQAPATGSTPDGSAFDVEPPTTEPAPAPPEPDPRWTAVLADARSAMIAGRCDTAIPLFDELIGDADWMATSSVVGQVRSERADCARFVHISSGSTDATDTMTAYLHFLSERPDTPLRVVAVTQIRQLYQQAGAAALGVDSCDAIDGDFSLLSEPGATEVALTCSASFAAAGRDRAAVAIATDVLRSADDAATVQQASDILVRDPSTCEGLGGGVDIVDPAERPDAHARLLRSCMSSTGDDLVQLALLQTRFIVDLPQHDAVAEVEAALIENVAACDHLGWMRQTPAFRDDLVLTATFECAQFASFVGETRDAIARYQWFLDHAADDPRVVDAEAGLAHNLIADARQGRNTPIDRPLRTGSSGGSHAQLRYSNDTVFDQHVVIVGPETRIVTAPASPTSATYSTPPLGCRTDVPTVTIELTPGTYDVMVYDDVAPPELGTWTLESGAEYGWCSYYVAA